MERRILVLILTSSIFIKSSLEESYCNVPNDCKILKHKTRHITQYNQIKCSLKSDHR